MCFFPCKLFRGDPILLRQHHGISKHGVCSQPKQVPISFFSSRGVVYRFGLPTPYLEGHRPRHNLLGAGCFHFSKNGQQIGHQPLRLIRGQILKLPSLSGGGQK